MNKKRNELYGYLKRFIKGNTWGYKGSESGCDARWQIIMERGSKRVVCEYIKWRFK